MDLIVKKCETCKNLVIGLNNMNDISCCGNVMKTLMPNSVDASFEKHIPTYEINGDMIIAKVNHVMEENHYIMWLCFVYQDEMMIKYFKTGDKPEYTNKYEKGMKIYSYCNTHELWVKEVL